jgi:hypothetical protein
MMMIYYMRKHLEEKKKGYTAGLLFTRKEGNESAPEKMNDLDRKKK